MFADRMHGVKKSGIREIFDLAQGLSSYINLGIGEPDFDTPSFVVNSARRAIEEGHTRYTSNVGMPELRDAIANKLKHENGIQADPEKEIIVTSGATQSIFILMNVLLNPGEEVILPTPLFTAYRYCATLAGANPVEVPLDEQSGYRLDVKKLEKARTRKTRLVVINSPCNPTGAVYSKKDVEEVCEFTRRNNLFLITDEIYEKFVYCGVKHFSAASKEEFKDRVITINGLSKTFAMTGWRIGYAVANEKVISLMTLYNMYNAVCAASFVQVAAAHALNHSRTFFTPILRKFEKRRLLLCEGLESVGLEFTRPSGAFFAFARLPRNSRNSLEFCKDLLLKKRLSTIPGSTFGEGGEGHFRVSFSVKEREIQVAMKRLKDYLSGKHTEH